MALSDKQKDCIIFYMGYSARTLDDTSTSYSRILAQRLDNFSEESEKRIKGMLTKLESLDAKLEKAQCRVSTVSIDGIKLNAEGEIRSLKKERRRCINELSRFSDIPYVGNANMGNVCV